MTFRPCHHFLFVLSMAIVILFNLSLMFSNESKVLDILWCLYLRKWSNYSSIPLDHLKANGLTGNRLGQSMAHDSTQLGGLLEKVPNFAFLYHQKLIQFRKGTTRALNFKERKKKPFLAKLSRFHNSHELKGLAY